MTKNIDHIIKGLLQSEKDLNLLSKYKDAPRFRHAKLQVDKVKVLCTELNVISYALNDKNNIRCAANLIHADANINYFIDNEIRKIFFPTKDQWNIIHEELSNFTLKLNIPETLDSLNNKLNFAEEPQMANVFADALTKIISNDSQVKKKERDYCMFLFFTKGCAQMDAKTFGFACTKILMQSIVTQRVSELRKKNEINTSDLKMSEGDGFTGLTTLSFSEKIGDILLQSYLNANAPLKFSFKEDIKAVKAVPRKCEEDLETLILFCLKRYHENDLTYSYDKLEKNKYFKYYQLLLKCFHEEFDIIIVSLGFHIFDHLKTQFADQKNVENYLFSGNGLAEYARMPSDIRLRLRYSVKDKMKEVNIKLGHFILTKACSIAPHIIALKSVKKYNSIKRDVSRVYIKPEYMSLICELSSTVAVPGFIEENFMRKQDTSVFPNTSIDGEQIKFVNRNYPIHNPTRGSLELVENSFFMRHPDATLKKRGIDRQFLDYFLTHFFIDNTDDLRTKQEKDERNLSIQEISYNSKTLKRDVPEDLMDSFLTYAKSMPADNVLESFLAEKIRKKKNKKKKAKIHSRFQKVKMFKWQLENTLSACLVYSHFRFFVITSFNDHRGREYEYNHFLSLQGPKYIKAFVKLYEVLPEQEKSSADKKAPYKDIVLASLNNPEVQAKLDIEIPDKVTYERLLEENIFKHIYAKLNPKLIHANTLKERLKKLEKQEPVNFSELFIFAKKHIKKNKDLLDFISCILYVTKTAKYVEISLSNALDATCSGLQVNAIYVKNGASAEHVNLKGDKRLDVYSLLHPYDEWLINKGKLLVLNFIKNKIFNNKELLSDTKILTISFLSVVFHKINSSLYKQGMVFDTMDIKPMDLDSKIGNAFSEYFDAYKDLEPNLEGELEELYLRFIPSKVQTILKDLFDFSDLSIKLFSTELTGDKPEKKASNNMMQLLLLFFIIKTIIFRWKFPKTELIFQNRAAWKHSIMIDTYGGTNLGRQRLFHKYIDDLVEDEEIDLSEETMYREDIKDYMMCAFAAFQAKYLHQNRSLAEIGKILVEDREEKGELNENQMLEDEMFLHPDSFKIQKSLNKIVRKKKYVTPPIINRTKNFVITMAPVKINKKKRVRLPGGAKAKRYRMYGAIFTDEKKNKVKIDKRKLITSFPPNVTHKGDAFILHAFTEIIYRIREQLPKNSEISLVAVHDTFGFGKAFSPYLRYALWDSYVSLYKENVLQNFLYITPEQQERINKYIKKPGDKDFLTIADLLTNPYFFTE